MCEQAEDMPALLFTENESNAERLWGVPGRTPFVKDGINDAVVNGARGTVNPEGVGTKVAAHYRFIVKAAATQTPISTPAQRTVCGCYGTLHASAGRGRSLLSGIWPRMDV